MNRPIAIVGAPSSIGIRPCDSGEMRHVDRAPAILRELGVIERLGWVDLGDVVPPAIGLRSSAGSCAERDIAPIPGTKRVARVEENTAVDGIELSAGTSIADS
jgi:hypothetical protein